MEWDDYVYLKLNIIKEVNVYKNIDIVKKERKYIEDKWGISCLSDFRGSNSVILLLVIEYGWVMYRNWIRIVR